MENKKFKKTESQILNRTQVLKNDFLRILLGISKETLQITLLA